MCCVKFHALAGRGGDRHAPANTSGIRHLAFAVDDIDAVVARLRARGAEFVGVERADEMLDRRLAVLDDVAQVMNRAVEWVIGWEHGHSSPHCRGFVASRKRMRSGAALS
jgi:catechol 2,3-dioxygenase-like lactoylglutathione lyase family enzyme